VSALPDMGERGQYSDPESGIHWLENNYPIPEKWEKGGKPPVSRGRNFVREWFRFLSGVCPRQKQKCKLG